MAISITRVEAVAYSDGKHTIKNSNATWAGCRDGTSGTPQAYNTVYSDYNTGLYYVDRNFLAFDTSSITGTITSVKLYIDPSITGTVSDLGTTNAYASTQASTSSLTANDFDNCGTTAYANTGITNSSVVANTYTSLTFNSTGIAAINKSGFTTICLRIAEKDVANSAPSTGINDAYTFTSNPPGTAGKMPYLEIVTENAVGKFRPLSETKFINDANLVSYWKLDGNSNDVKSAANGTDTSMTYDTGKYGQAGIFSGSGYITLGNVSALNIATNYTISTTVYVTSYGGYYTIIGKTNSSAIPQPYDLRIDQTTGKIQFAIGSSGTFRAFTTTNAVPTNQWVHIVVTYTTGDDPVIYMNATSQAYAKSGTAVTPTASSENIYIGRNTYGFNFVGKIDDISFFSRALSASEVNELYQGMTLGEYLGDTTAQFELQNTDLINDSSLVSYWRMEGNSNDSKGSNTLTNTNVTYLAGKYGQAGSFNGSSSRLVKTGSNLNLTSFSYGYWAKGTGTVYSIDNGANNHGFRSAYSATNITFDGGVPIRETTNFPITNDISVWNHIVITYNGSTRNLIIYKNGVAVSNITRSSNSPIVYSTTTPQLTIGAEYDTNIGGSYRDWFNGSLDEIFVFNKILTLAEINTLYRIGTTKLLLHLNGNSTDSSGNNNNGTDTAITYSQANGRFGMGAGFNGSSSQIQSTVTGNSVFTVNTWVKITSFPGENVYFMIRRNTANNANYGMYLNSLSQFGLNCYNGSVGPSFSTDETFSTGVWYNIVGVFNGASSAIYVNGKLSKSGTLLTHTSGNDTFLGANSGVSFYTGLMDETIIENIAWTPQQVAKYYTFSKGRFGIT